MDAEHKRESKRVSIEKSHKSTSKNTYEKPKYKVVSHVIVKKTPKTKPDEELRP